MLFFLCLVTWDWILEQGKILLARYISLDPHVIACVFFFFVKAAGYNFASGGSPGPFSICYRYCFDKIDQKLWWRAQVCVVHIKISCLLQLWNTPPAVPPSFHLRGPQSYDYPIFVLRVYMYLVSYSLYSNVLRMFPAANNPDVGPLLCWYLVLILCLFKTRGFSLRYACDIQGGT